MRSISLSRVDNRINTVYNQLRAGKSKHGVIESDDIVPKKRKGGGEGQLHLGQLFLFLMVTSSFPITIAEESTAEVGTLVLKYLYV